MRHGKKNNHLGRTASHRQALLSNMASSLILSKRIETTLAKAKELRKYVEPLINRTKNDNTNGRRVVFSYLQNKEALKELFGIVAEKVADRPGGYTRIIKLGNRLGDNAEICMMELVDFNEIYVKEVAEKKTRRGRRKSGSGVVTNELAEPAVIDTDVVVMEDAPAAATSVADDLKIVEGIGSKTEEVLHAAGVNTFVQLASMTAEAISEILDNSGERVAHLDPATWAAQAQMAVDGKWDELKAWQDELNAGKAE